MVLGLRGTAIQVCRVAGAALLFAVPLSLPGCGEASKNEDTPYGAAAQGSGGASGTGGGSSATGGGGASGSSAGTGSAGRPGASGKGGGSATGGAGGKGGGSATGGAGGTGGKGGGGAGGMAGMGPGPAPGFACNGGRCELGERCAFCKKGEGTFTQCVPDPDEDPSGYQEAMAGCMDAEEAPFTDCDGPEDCKAGEYCVFGAKPGQVGAACMTEAELPNPATQSCCFTCDALPECTLCWTDEDCPEAQLCKPVDASGGIGGCRVAD